MKKTLLIGAIAAISFFYSCGDDTTPTPNNNNNNTDTTGKDTSAGPCAGVQANYTAISQIITANCAGGCHNTGIAGISLNTYDEVKLAVESGRLLASIRHEQGVSPMPKGRSKLSDAQIKQFECWKANGYPRE